MRQAGRYLPEYRQLRGASKGFLDLCYTPEKATEATLQPLRRFDLDAAIIFSDILVLPHALGQKVTFEAGEGPRLAPYDPNILGNTVDMGRLAPVYEAVDRVRGALAPEKDLIGFSGAPWTLACYMLEGQGTKAFDKARLFGFQSPAAMKDLLARLVEVAAHHLIAQVDAGATVLQVFESWGGVCPWSRQGDWVVAPMREIVARVKQRHPRVPIIGFPRGLGGQISRYAQETGVDAVSLDQATPPQEVAEALPQTIVPQGGLDPQALVCGGDVLAAEVQRYLRAFQGRPHVFNLGHGVVPQTPPERVSELLALVRQGVVSDPEGQKK